MKVDIAVGLAWGDEGKGKCVYSLLRKNSYDIICKASGGPNAGHSFYHNGEKFATHHIPAGVFFNKKSLIGSGCLVYPLKLFEEIENLESRGIKVKDNLLISKNAHIITDAHIKEDRENNKVGSTGTGIMPAYRDKYARCGIRAQEADELKPFLYDQRELHYIDGSILIEGSQGYGLCPDGNNYPFVTSSPPTSTYALHSLGLPPRKVNNIYGISKIYDSYVGSKKFQPDGEIFKKIAEVGKEIGTTTGRRRQVNFLNINLLIEAIRANGVDALIVNKVDVLRQLEVWAVQINGTVVNFENEEEMKNYIEFNVYSVSPYIDTIFSDNPYEI